MIHHVSFGVGEPRRVAHALAELTGATALRAPTPPFPHGSWLVVAGDARGSFLEILPAAFVFDPDAPLGLRQRPAKFEAASTHVLVSAAVSADTIKAVAAREAWPAQEVETGLFKIVKLWIDGTVLVEVLAKGEVGRYVDTFGASGMATLDETLCRLETDLSAALSAKLPAGALRAALGSPAE